MIEKSNVFFEKCAFPGTITDKCNEARVSYAESVNADVLVSLHLNYYHSSNVNGLQVFYQKNNYESEKLAKTLQKKLNNENKKNKNHKVGDYYLLNNCSKCGVLIEYGFLSSEYDRKKLLNDSYLDYLANIIKEGIYEYLNTI